MLDQQFTGSQFVFAGYSDAPFSNRAFNLRLRVACKALGVGEITAHGLRHSAVTILLNDVGKDLREIQELLRPKTSAPRGATPTSATSRPGRLRRRSAKFWIEVLRIFFLPGVCVPWLAATAFEAYSLHRQVKTGCRAERVRDQTILACANLNFEAERP